MASATAAPVAGAFLASGEWDGTKITNVNVLFDKTSGVTYSKFNDSTKQLDETLGKVETGTDGDFIMYKGAADAVARKASDIATQLISSKGIAFAGGSRAHGGSRSKRTQKRRQRKQRQNGKSRRV
jgi:hypothetical protein